MVLQLSKICFNFILYYFLKFKRTKLHEHIMSQTDKTPFPVQPVPTYLPQPQSNIPPAYNQPGVYAQNVQPAFIYLCIVNISFDSYIFDYLIFKPKLQYLYWRAQNVIKLDKLIFSVFNE